MANTRTYKVKDVEMLLASKTITQTLGDNLADLSIARSNWSETYVSELSTKIDDAIENYLGLDKKKELRDATGKLATIQVPALRDLSFLKTQLEVDFGNEAKEIKKKLGYDKNLRNVQKGDQEALIQLLYTFKKGMTGDLKTSIVNKGTNVALIDRIIGYADQLKEANVTQETLKETSKEVSGEAVNIFNGIYDEIIGICKIAANYYQYDELKKDQFTFSKVVANMNATRKIGTQGEEIIE
jgi:hypothetical protein